MKLKIDVEEVKILFHYCKLIEDEWGSASTIKEYELQEKLENYIEKKKKRKKRLK